MPDDSQIMMLLSKQKDIGFLNGLVSNMNENTEIKRNRIVTKGGIVKDLRNITQEVKQY